MKKTIYKVQSSAIVRWLLCVVILSGMMNVSNAQTCGANAGSPITICAGTTTGPLGGSFSAGATSAIWSDGGAGGTFANNDGSTPGAATYTASSSALGAVTLTLTATGACEPTTATKVVTVNHLQSQNMVTFYDYSCDRTTYGFSNVSQAFVAPFSGYITQVNAGIGLWMNATAYQTIISTPSHTIDYGVLGYSGRCCYSPCATGNNMASTNLPTAFYVNAGEAVTISFSGSGGELHYQDGILRMYIAGHSLVDGTAITADGATTFCQGNSVNLDAGNFASYNWSPSGNTESINVTETNNYSVVVSDVNGCSASSSHSVNVNPLPTVGANASPSSTVSTGTSVTLTGTGASTYSWSDGITDGVAFTAVSTNTYTVTGTDGNGCLNTATQTIIVTEVQIDNTPPSIFCPPNIVMNADQGQCGAVVTYSVTATDNIVASSLAVQDQTSPDGGYITDPKTSSWQSFTAGVSGQLTGVAVEGWWTNGTTGYTLNIYSGDGISGTLLYTQSGIVLPNSGPGILDILQLTGGVSLTAGQQYTWNLTNPSAFRLIGYPWASYNGGRGDEYNLQGGWEGMDYHFATYTVPSSVTVVSTPASGSIFSVGTTTVNSIATDAAGNTSTCSFTVTVIDNQNPTITSPQNVVVVADAGMCSSERVVLGTPITGDNCAVLSVTNNHPSSTYPVGTTTVTWTVTDVNGNSSTSTQTVIVTGSPISVTNIGSPSNSCGYNISCNGGNNGSASVSVSGGCSPYAYLWSNGATSSTASGLTAGTYSVVITDSRGTTTTASITLSQPSALSSSFTKSVYGGGYNVACNGGGNGTINTTVSGGCAPYSFAWTGSNSFASASQNLSGLSAGTYSLTITDANGCVRVSSATLTQPSALSANAGANEWTYYGFTGDQTVSHTATATGGVGPYAFSWTMNRPLKCNMVTSAGDESFSSGSCTFNSCPSTPLNINLSSNPVCSGSAAVTITLLDTATLTVTVTDANGCTASATFTVYAQDARCFAGNSGSAKVSICHHAGNNWVQLCVDSAAVSALVANGDYVGKCISHREGEMEEPNLNSVSYLTAYPNPFTETTTIAFSVPNDGNTVIRIFDALGKQVSVLFDGMAKSGIVNKVVFDGSAYPWGIYFYSIVANGMNETKKLQIIK